MSKAKLLLLLPFMGILPSCAQNIDPAIVGFDGSVVKINVEKGWGYADNEMRVAAASPRAKQFCQSRGFKTATFQREMLKTVPGPFWNMQDHDYMAFLCEN